MKKNSGVRLSVFWSRFWCWRKHRGKKYRDFQTLLNSLNRVFLGSQHELGQLRPASRDGLLEQMA